MDEQPELHVTPAQFSEMQRVIAEAASPEAGARMALSVAGLSVSEISAAEGVGSRIVVDHE